MHLGLDGTLQSPTAQDQWGKYMKFWRGGEVRSDLGMGVVWEWEDSGQV